MKRTLAGSILAVLVTGCDSKPDTLATSLERLTVQGEKATESTDGFTTVGNGYYIQLG
ncbi:hypothetical protein MASR2M36_19560 [Providencia sp.]